MRRLANYATRRKRLFDEDLEKAARGSAVFLERVERRIVKIRKSPQHHGYHAGGVVRCSWIAGVGDWAIIYEINEESQTLIFLRFLSLDDV